MRVKVEFEVEVPDDMPDDCVLEWLRFSFGDNGTMKERHPGMTETPEPIFGTFDIKYL